MEKNTEIKSAKFKDLFLNAEGGFIPMPRQLSRVLGFNATGLLEELYDRYDYYIEKDLLDDYGEFFYTVADCEINTGLSRREQEGAIKKLTKVEYKFIEDIKQRGMPRKRYFKLNNNPLELINKMYTEAESMKTEIKDKAAKEAERCRKLTNTLSNAVGTKQPYYNVQNSPTITDETAVLERTKPPVINNYDKELLKTKIITILENDPFKIAKNAMNSNPHDYKDFGYEDDGLDF
ncbi:hypothetical protein LL033_17340 [Clostridium estertheticum]|uniref:hypothetical protein n=1 Tax=Clostridium estertheticum TaxID=238834 RepID=UPI001C0C4A2F|nr:hypothetical protein [Clostridium estertheticum]MBU3216666.1 hypothetical protein [Clostridium estertheticum]WAG54378.1 hypothetical protein LL033_17340 [Clostridium estertheticum]